MKTANGPAVLIVGAGHGCRVHLPALRHAGFEVVGLVGRDIDRTSTAAGRHGIANAFVDLDEAITRTGATAVTIASPPHTHAGVVRTALTRQCHVLCEKPFAKDAAEARTLLEAARRAGVVHMLGNQMRTLPHRVMVGRAIAEGVIGEPRFLTLVQYGGLVADPAAKRPAWWFDEEAGGGWLGASGSHMIDMVRSWLGEFETVSAALPIVSDRKNVAEDSYVARFRMANGTEGVLQQTGGAWGPFAEMVRLAGTHGTLWVESGKVFVADRQGTRQIEIPSELLLEPMEPSTDPRKPYLHLELPPSQRLFALWRAAIEGRGTPDMALATFEDGLAAMEVIDAVRASAREGGTTRTVARA